jgi:hypothetical protein
MKKTALCAAFCVAFCVSLFAQETAAPASEESYAESAHEPVSIDLKIVSYLVSRKQNSARFASARLTVNDATQTWEVVLHKKDGSAPDRILMEESDPTGANMYVFRKITIFEGDKTSGGDLFAYMPNTKDGRIQIDLCDKRTEGVRRRLILSI